LSLIEETDEDLDGEIYNSTILENNNKFIEIPINNEVIEEINNYLGGESINSTILENNKITINKLNLI